MDAPNQLSVFVSYAHKDGAEIAQRLGQDLIAKGYQVWLDHARLRAGASWSVEIEAAIDRADVLVALLSEGSYVSNVCRGEQLRALRKGTRVVPLLLKEDVDRPVFLEANHFVLFGSRPYEESVNELVAALASRDTAVLAQTYDRTYVTAPRLPKYIVSRPPELVLLQQQLLREEPGATMSVVALTGMGGLGKSTLARMVAHEPAVQSGFPDGVIWIEIGREVTDLVPKLREVGRAFHDDARHYDTIEGSTNRLRTILQKKAALIILDDVWQLEHVEPFLADVPTSRLLITTRLNEIAISLLAVVVTPDTLTPAQALAVLEKWTGLSQSSMPPVAGTIVRECGYLPLAVSMIGGLVRSGLSKGRADSWADAARRLQARQLDAISFPLENYGYRQLNRAIQVSVDDLEPHSRERYIAMGIFSEDSPVPERVLERAWFAHSSEVRVVVDGWLDASLATRDSLGRITLHDLQLDYVRNIAGATLGSQHGRFLDRYRDTYQEAWPVTVDDPYFLQHVAYHMAAAGRWRELAGLLINPRFIRAKIDAFSYVEFLHDFKWKRECLAAFDTHADQALFTRIEAGAQKHRSFMNRVSETGAIEHWLADEAAPPHLIVTGEAGIGKTALLKHVEFRALQDWTFVVLRVDWLSGSWLADNLVRELWFQLCLRLEEAPDGWKPLREDSISRVLSAFQSAVRSVASKHGTRVCVVVDGVRDFAPFVHDMLLFPWRSQNVRFVWVGGTALRLLEERGRSAGMPIVELNAISPELTVKALRALLDRKFSDAELGMMVKVAGGSISRLDQIREIVQRMHDPEEAH